MAGVKARWLLQSQLEESEAPSTFAWRTQQPCPAPRSHAIPSTALLRAWYVYPASSRAPLAHDLGCYNVVDLDERIQGELAAGIQPGDIREKILFLPISPYQQRVIHSRAESVRPELLAQQKQVEALSQQVKAEAKFEAPSAEKLKCQQTTKAFLDAGGVLPDLEIPLSLQPGGLRLRLWYSVGGSAELQIVGASKQWFSNLVEMKGSPGTAGMGIPGVFAILDTDRAVNDLLQQIQLRADDRHIVQSVRSLLQILRAKYPVHLNYDESDPEPTVSIEIGDALRMARAMPHGSSALLAYQFEIFCLVASLPLFEDRARTLQSANWTAGQTIPQALATMAAQTNLRVFGSSF